MLLHTRPALKIGSHPPTGALAFHVGSSSTFRRHSLPLSLTLSLSSHSKFASHSIVSKAWIT